MTQLPYTRQQGIASPLLHDVFKATLDYYSEDVINIVRKRVRSTLFEDPAWSLNRIRQERHVSSLLADDPTIGFIDVVWAFDHTSELHGLRKGLYHVFHEVKTGRFDLDRDIIEKYTQMGFNKKNIAGRWTKQRVGGGDSQFWVWAWHNQIVNTVSKSPETAKMYRRGVLRLLPLELLFPLIEAELGRIGFEYTAPPITIPQELPRISMNGGGCR